MRKKWLSLCMGLVLLFALLTATAYADDVELKKVHASTPEELENALQSDTVIELDGKDYVFENSLDLVRLKNVRIQGTNGTRIISTSNSSLVIDLRSCNDLTIENVSCGHDIPAEADCVNGVLYVQDSQVQLNNCDFFGCGLIGIESYNATITAVNTTIRDCSKRIMEVYGIGRFTNCTFSGNGYAEPDIYAISLSESSNVEFYGCNFSSNQNPSFADEPNRITKIENCSFSGNGWDKAVENISEYLYDISDPGENTKLPTGALDGVTDSASAVNAVKQMTGGMTSEQKSSPTGVDLATLYAETAASMAARKAVDSGEITVNAASVADQASTAAQTTGAVESTLSSGGITTARYLAKTVTLTTDETDISIQLDPDILTAGVDRIRVETPAYALTLILADLKEDLTEPLTFKAQEAVSSYALKRTDGKTTVMIDLPKVQMTNPVIVSLPKDSGDTTYQAVIRADGTAAASKFNPATLTMDGRINTSGTYTVKSNEKSFSDISGKSAEMQKAILYLTSRGIINGTSATEFSPDKSISRQQIAALLMRALGKVDNTATTTFTDVSQNSSLYHAIASSQRHKIINGYSDNTFRGTNVISKTQIVTVSGRVLTSEMNYKTLGNTSTYLGKYTDSIPNYAQDMVALATREGLVVYRTDGTFSGDKNMTRGDAAIILYRLFQKIW